MTETLPPLPRIVLVARSRWRERLYFAAGFALGAIVGAISLLVLLLRGFF